jgi:Spy/CpxP family protein refolding chaperone
MKLKISTLLPSLICGLVTAISPALLAQDAPAATSPAASPAASPAPDAAKQRVDPLERLTTALTLTDDQKAKIKPILDARQEKMKALKGDTTLTDEQKQAKRKEIFDAGNADIKALLTPDQVKKFEDLQQKMQDRRKAAPGN